MWFVNFRDNVFSKQCVNRLKSFVVKCLLHYLLLVGTLTISMSVNL